MAFVDKVRNGLTSAPARFLLIGSSYFLNISSGNQLEIEPSIAGTDWTDKTRNTT